VLVFEEKEKPEYPEKTSRSKEENQQQTQPTYDTGTGSQTRATAVIGVVTETLLPRTQAGSLGEARYHGRPKKAKRRYFAFPAKLSLLALRSL